MTRLLSVLAAVAVVGGWAFADDKKEEKKADDTKAAAPAGVWTKKAENDLTIQLDFTTKDTLVVTNSIDDKRLVITCKLAADKDGKWKATASKVENTNEFPVTVSDKFEMTFKLKVEKDAATVSDFGCNEHEEQAKGAVEGEYKKKEDK
jgi:hypothetical protein